MTSSDFPGFFCILMFCGLFFRFNSLPFLNHLNLREEYSELVSHRSTSLEPAADSWLFISFNLGGKAALWPPAGGFLPEPRSFFLPFPLALPSLRSDISLEKCTLYADGSGRRQHAASLVPGLGSDLRSFSLEGKSDPAAALSQHRGVSCCLRGADRTRRAVQATWD